MTAFNNFIDSFISIDTNDYNVYIILLVLFFVMLIYFVIQGNLNTGLDIKESTTNIDNFLNNILTIIILICVFVIIIVFVLSFVNFFIVIYYILSDFFSSLFNDNLINSDTYHSKLINLLKCTEDNYSNDNLFIFMNEYLIIAMSRVLYSVLGVIFVYVLVILVLFVYYNAVLEEDYLFNFGIDITFIKLSIFIFFFIIIQISLFTIIFNTYIINNYDNIYNDNKSIDEFIFENLPTTDNFYNLLKKDINDLKGISIFINDVTDIDNLSKYLLLYDLYKYFNKYISLSSSNYYLIEEYLKNKNKDINFYDLLNVKVVLPIQKYHKELDIFDDISQYGGKSLKLDSSKTSSLTTLDNIEKEKNEKIKDIEKRISHNIKNLNDNIKKINKYIINKNNTTSISIYYILLYCILMICLMVFTIIGLMYIIVKGDSKYFNENIFYIKNIKDYFNFLLKKIKIM